MVTRHGITNGSLAYTTTSSKPNGPVWTLTNHLAGSEETEYHKMEIDLYTKKTIVLKMVLRSKNKNNSLTKSYKVTGKMEVQITGLLDIVFSFPSVVDLRVSSVSSC